MLSLACRPARHRLNPSALYIRTYRWTGSSAFAQRPGCRPPPLSSHPPPPRRDQAYPSHGTSVRLLFPFSTLNTTTRVLHNPKLDDDGNPMLINISPQAAKRLREITDPSSKKPTLPVIPEGVVQDHLRVTVSSGGCHGFQYLMTLDPASTIDPEEDTIFEAEPEDSGESSPDGKPLRGEAKVVMDSASLELLSGSTVDYTMELIGSQFKITNNPRATSSCGCGTSFDVPE
ncbi:hypothetical protein EMCG_00294 [[Emmonsia] crescens]|uniref:Uncharacterized protein n=1 Tax=[Emmonsia] crescens TaxID=73230 RepID=A0A0G2J939_9EURO|nr:hypothetical protein EMCG_00294 [Emmonsia crescens UAMH 3008]